MNGKARGILIAVALIAALAVVPSAMARQTSGDDALRKLGINAVNATKPYTNCGTRVSCIVGITRFMTADNKLINYLNGRLNDGTITPGNKCWRAMSKMFQTGKLPVLTQGQSYMRGGSSKTAVLNAQLLFLSRAIAIYKAC